MNSLLRADFSRIFKHKSTVYTMLIVLLVIAFAYAILVPILQEAVRSNPSTASELTTDKPGFPMPVAYAITALLLFGNAGFLVCWAVTSVVWADARSGYDRTIISACGKRTYYREKFVLAAIISVLFVFISAILGSVASGIVSGYEDIGSIPEFFLWCCLVSIISWGSACVSLVVLWLTRNSTVAYLTGFVLSTGLLSSVMTMVLGNVSADVAQAWGEFCKWLPTGAYNALETVTDGHINFGGENLLRMIVAPVVCLSVSYYVGLYRLPKRDL